MQSSSENAEVLSTGHEALQTFANFCAVMKMVFDHCSPEYTAGRGPTKSPIDHTRFLALAMAGEAGEALNIVKKNWRGDGPLDIEKLVDEVADTLNYGLMLGAFLRRDMLFIMRKKLEGFERKLVERQNNVQTT